jgi:hypothetical protein
LETSNVIELEEKYGMEKIERAQKIMSRKNPDNPKCCVNLFPVSSFIILLLDSCVYCLYNYLLINPRPLVDGCRGQRIGV